MIGEKSLHTVFLDQNKWIDLARAAKHPAEHPDLQPLLARIREEMAAGRLILPLTFANIYETQKVNDPERRRDLAFVQAFLSRGLVIRARHSRLRAEVWRFLGECCGLKTPDREAHWFLSNIFFEAAAEMSYVRQKLVISERVISCVRSHPEACLFDYLVETPENVRTMAVRNFTAGSDRLRAAIEARRRKHAGETLAMRRRIYSAILMIDDFERIIGFANEIGLPWRGTEDIGEKIARRLMNEVPTYHVEREIALRLEAQSRSIKENDFRDMQAFCAAIPYADLVVGENQFVNLARQAGLDRKYRTLLATDVRALERFLDDP